MEREEGGTEEWETHVNSLFKKAGTDLAVVLLGLVIPLFS